MSESLQEPPGDAAPEYLGERAARRPAAALGLNLVVPGLGYLYCGRPLAAAVLWMLTTVPVLALVLAGWRLGVFIVKPVGLALLLYGYVQTGMGIDLVRLCRVEGGDYLLRGYNHASVYAVAVLVVLGSGAIAVSVARTEVVGVLQVEGLAMYPRLVPGDRVVYDRQAFQSRDPIRGELVVARLSGEAEPQILRVVGLPGEEIVVHGADVLVDGALLPTAPYARVRLDPPIEERGDGRPLVATTEFSMDHALHYAIFHGAGRRRGDTVGPILLGPAEFFLLGDYRDAADALDSRLSGPVSREQLLGHPRHVCWSRHALLGVRWERIGLSADAAPLPSEPSK